VLALSNKTYTQGPEGMRTHSKAPLYVSYTHLSHTSVSTELGISQY